jgi:large subunit ribosomal protein L20
MARTKSIAAIRHRKIKKAARGFKHARSRRVKNAKESLLHAGQYAYNSRRILKRDLRKLWITRINIAAREHGMKYSDFIKNLNDKKILLDRKILSEIAVKDPDTFEKIVSAVK